VIEHLLLHLFIGHHVEGLERAIDATRATGVAVVAEDFEARDLPGHFTIARVHDVLELVLLVQPEAHALLRHVEEIDDLQREGARNSHSMRE